MRKMRILEKIKTNRVLAHLRERMKSAHRSGEDYQKKTLAGELLISMVISSVIVEELLRLLFPTLVLFAAILLAVVIVFAVCELLSLLFRIIFGNSSRNVSYFLATWTSLFWVIMNASQAEHIGTNIIAAIILTLFFDLLGRKICFLAKYIKTVHDKKRVWHIVTGGILCICAIGVAFFVAGEGWTDSYRESYLDAEQDGQHFAENMDALEHVTPESVTLESFAALGNYEVGTYTYGMHGEEIESCNINISDFAERGLVTGASTEKYLGYDMEHVPVSGKIWYPMEKKACPVLFFVHGNHAYTTPSFLGYEYLGNYLASYGYVVVSVDENSCNDLEDETDARAVLLLENIKELLSWNHDVESPVHGLIDEEKIAIGGHSRGGETVATAYLFNDYDSYPDNGKIQFDYHFSIKAVLAVAPTADLYVPTGQAVKIKDVNYLLIQGADDSDVSHMMGEKQYENVSYSGKGDYLKSMIYVAGANHGQFNSLWGRYDMGFPYDRFLNVKGLLTEAEQQQILQIFTKAFLDMSLLGDESGKRLLTDCENYSDILPVTIYEQAFQTSDYMAIGNFDEDSDLNTMTVKNGRMKVENISEWKEFRRVAGDGGAGENQVLELRFENGEMPKITCELEPLNLEQRRLVFDIADMRETMEELDPEEQESEEVMAGEHPDGTIQLTDINGNMAETRISNHTWLYPTLPVQLRKLDVLFGEYEYKHQFQTVSIPYDGFEQKNQKMDYSKITKIEIYLDELTNGEIQIDNIGTDTY